MTEIERIRELIYHVPAGKQTTSRRAATDGGTELARNLSQRVFQQADRRLLLLAHRDLSTHKLRFRGVRNGERYSARQSIGYRQLLGRRRVGRWGDAAWSN